MFVNKEMNLLLPPCSVSYCHLRQSVKTFSKMRGVKCWSLCKKRHECLMETEFQSNKVKVTNQTKSRKQKLKNNMKNFVISCEFSKH